MFRNIIAVIAGIVVAGMTVATVEGLGHWLVPLPADLDTSDVEQLRAYAQDAPMSAMLMVIIAWTLGTFTGGVAAAWLGDRRPWLFAGSVALVVAMGAAANLIMLPHPTWFGIAGLAGIVIATVVASLVSRRLPPIPLAGAIAANTADSDRRHSKR